jgi:hypothetical protein
MKEQIYSALRTALTALAGLGGLLASKGAIAPEDVASIDTASIGIADGLAVIGAALLMRLFIFLGGKLKAVSGGNAALLGMVAALLLGLGALPSCAATFNPDGSASLSTDPDAAISVIDKIADFFRPEPTEPVEPVLPITPEDSAK